MKDLFDPVLVKETKERVLRLRPESVAAWGSMTVTPAMTHCTRTFGMAMGEVAIAPPRLPVRMLGRVVKVLALRDEAPMRRNSPSAAELFSGEGEGLEFAAEQERLVRAVDRFASEAPSSGGRRAHPFFGPLSARQWAVLMYKHMDHHLRQFGV